MGVMTEKSPVIRNPGFHFDHITNKITFLTKRFDNWLIDTFIGKEVHAATVERLLRREFLWLCLP